MAPLRPGSAKERGENGSDVAAIARYEHPHRYPLKSLDIRSADIADSQSPFCASFTLQMRAKWPDKYMLEGGLCNGLAERLKVPLGPYQDRRAGALTEARVSVCVIYTGRYGMRTQ